MFQAYDLTLCDILCDHGHMSLYYPRKTKQNKIENKIKENKEKIKIKY